MDALDFCLAAAGVTTALCQIWPSSEVLAVLDGLGFRITNRVRDCRSTVSAAAALVKLSLEKLQVCRLAQSNKRSCLHFRDELYTPQIDQGRSYFPVAEEGYVGGSGGESDCADFLLPVIVPGAGGFDGAA